MKRREMILLSGAAAAYAALPFRTHAKTGKPPVNALKLGIEILLAEHLGTLKDKRVGLVTNHTGVNRQLVSDIDLLRSAGVNLVALFAPEHGVRGEAQASQKVETTTDAATALPVFSLYGATKEPTAAMLSGVDILLFDIQDVGTRFYTYPSTLLFVLRAAGKHGVEVIVLDRPNPLGGEQVEGPVLEPVNGSFVGIFPMPVRHGMTMGELATMFVAAEKLPVKFQVIRMAGWKRGDDAFATGLPWVPPSPNIPSREAAFAYPGTALFEGTNISEGRGTTKPFEQIGAPFINVGILAGQLNDAKLPGVMFAPTWFTPTFSKFSGQLCGGVMLHILDRAAFRPFRTGVAMTKAVHDLHPDAFQFRAGAPSYFDQLAGTASVREDIVAGKSIEAIEARWQPELERFAQKRKSYLLY